DADPYTDAVAKHVKGLIDRRDQSTGQTAHLALARSRSLQHSELITAQPRDQVVVPRAVAQATSDLLQQRVTDVVTQCIVHCFEAVEVKVVDRQGSIGETRAREDVSGPLLEQHAIWKFCDRIKERELMDFGSGLLLFEGDRAQMYARGHRDLFDLLRSARGSV